MTEEVAADPGGSNGSPSPADTVAAAVPAEPLAPEYVASFHPGPDDALPDAFAGACKRLEDALGVPLWLLVQNTSDRDDPLGSLGLAIRNQFFRARRELASCTGAALLIDSPGGYAESAYEIARLFQRHCGGFKSIVPRYAKSAATLLVLGGPLIMGEDAELGPLDAQIFDPEREEMLSALNEVQALERLHLQAVEEVDLMMPLLQGRTRKKISTLLPMVLDFVASMKSPLLEKLDTVHYTQQARVLKEAEDYAVRLLQRAGLDEGTAQEIPSRLVNRYPDHSFVIDREEAAEFIPMEAAPSEDAAMALSDLADFLADNHLVALGRFDAKNAI
ncbi:MAG TPA: hypothetical protein VGN13_08145 [Solirubrobacteraceae bacterium]